MIRQSPSIYFRISILVMILILISGCATGSGATIASNSSPQVIVQGNNSNKEEVQTIELDNCNGKGATTRTEQRSQSVDVTVSAELAAKLGVSADVISAEVQAAVGVSESHNAQSSTSIQLVAPPQTHMIFQLTWTGNEQIGIVQNLRASSIPIAFRSFTPTDVRFKSQSDIGCPGSGANVPQPIITLQIPQSDGTIQPVADYCYGKCWEYDNNARTMTWTGTKDGVEDIWQADGEPLEKIRAGYTAYFEINFPMKMEICMGSIDGTLVSRQCEFQVIDISAGRHTVVSAGPQGGFRVRPQ